MMHSMQTAFILEVKEHVFILQICKESLVASIIIIIYLFLVYLT